MCTEKQASANRLNAQKSTGPKTPEGKEKVSQNAVTHGLTAFRPVLTNENPEEYTLFRDDFIRRHIPVGILEESLAQRAVDTLWRLQRAEDYETAVLNTLIKDARDKTNPNDQMGGTAKRSLTVELEEGQDNLNDLLGQVLLDDFRQTHCLEKIQKYEMAIERSYYRTVKELRHLQSLRLKVTEASSFGVSSINSKNEKNKPNLPERHRVEVPTSRGEDGQTRQNNPKQERDGVLSLRESRPISQNYGLSTFDSFDKTNPFDLDPLTKIIMKKDNFQRLSKKAM